MTSLKRPLGGPKNAPGTLKDKVAMQDRFMLHFWTKKYGVKKIPIEDKQVLKAMREYYHRARNMDLYIATRTGP